MRNLILLLTVFSLAFFSCKRNSNQKVVRNEIPKSQSSKKPTQKTNPEKKAPKKNTPKSSESAKVDGAIKEARSFVGTPYKYGGNTRSGIDCSGLTCQAYKAIGVTLPRTANDQATFGQSIKTPDIQKGDLVFFTDRKGNSKITHVGMVTEVSGPGKVKFIHASTKAGVIEADLFSDYYKAIFLKAVRVVK